MRKKLIPILITLVVIGGMVGVLFWLNDEDAVEDPGDELTYVVEAPEGVKATRLSVQNGAGSFEVSITPAAEGSVQSEYTLAGFEDYALARYTITPMVNALESLTAKVVVAEGDGIGYGDYGLSTPQATATATYSDGSSETLLVGSEAPGGAGYYVKTGSDPDVYLVNSVSAENFLSGTLDLLDKTITESIEESFLTARLSGTVREEIVEIGPLEAEEDSDTMMLESHRILTPVSASLDSQNGFAAIQAAFGISAAEVVDRITDDSVLRKYGLDEAYSVLTVSSETLGILTLSASAPDEEGMVYLTRSGVDLVYQVHSEYLPWLEVTFFDLMQKMAVLPYIDDVGTILLTTSAGETRVTLTGEGQELEVRIDGELIETSHFRSFYQNMVYASYDALPEEPLPEGSEAVLTFTYQFRNSSTPDEVLAFYEGPARKVYMIHNGGREFLGLSTYVDKMIGDIDSLRAGEEIRTFI